MSGRRELQRAAALSVGVLAFVVVRQVENAVTHVRPHVRVIRILVLDSFSGVIPEYERGRRFVKVQILCFLILQQIFWRYGRIAFAIFGNNSVYLVLVATRSDASV
jgi:hypothetical protein